METNHEKGQEMAPERARVGFEAVTVRAAARLVRMRRQGSLNQGELNYYLSELAALDEKAPRGGGRALARVAHRYAARGGAGRRCRRQQPQPGVVGARDAVGMLR